MTLDNVQYGPPGSADVLADVVAHITYKPGWEITVTHQEVTGEHLGGGHGLYLGVGWTAENSCFPGSFGTPYHVFAVPPASYNRETWERWVLDCLIECERHEAMEFFKVDGKAPFFPAHGMMNGHSPYTIAHRRPGDGLPGAPAW